MTNLLSASHLLAASKSPVFQAMGYSQDRWEQLAADLREQHVLSEVDEVVESPHGRKYIIRANLKGPNGRTFAMVSIWMVLKGEDVSRFVTAYPGEE